MEYGRSMHPTIKNCGKNSEKFDCNEGRKVRPFYNTSYNTKCPLIWGRQCPPITPIYCAVIFSFSQPIPRPHLCDFGIQPIRARKAVPKFLNWNTVLLKSADKDSFRYISYFTAIWDYKNCYKNLKWWNGIFWIFWVL